MARARATGAGLLSLPILVRPLSFETFDAVVELHEQEARERRAGCGDAQLRLHGVGGTRGRTYRTHGHCREDPHCDGNAAQQVVHRKTLLGIAVAQQGLANETINNHMSDPHRLPCRAHREYELRPGPPRAHAGMAATSLPRVHGPGAPRSPTPFRPAHKLPSVSRRPLVPATAVTANVGPSSTCST